MVISKISLVKKTGGNACIYHPASSADIVTYESSLTVQDVLDAIVDSVEQIENRLANGGIYMTNNRGEIITDASGVGLVEIL